MSIPLSISQDQKPTNSHSFKTLITDSFRIFSRNKHIYLLIFTFITFPLSFLHFHLSLSSHPIQSQIHHLEFLASRAPTRFEARQVWKESRETLLSLIHLKLFYFLPIYTLSLFSAVSLINSTESRYNRKPTSIHTVLASFKGNLMRPCVTAICIYVVLIVYSSVFYVFSSIIRNSFVKLKFFIWIFQLGVEIFIMVVLGLGLVVSVLENRFGFDAFRIGYRLMKGRGITGWVLSAFFAVVAGGIGGKMADLVEEGTAEGWEGKVLIGVYAVVVIWGFVVFTVFYCECRKRHVVKGGEEEEESPNGENLGSTSS